VNAAGLNGLGELGPIAAVDDFLNGGRWKLIKEYVEVESGKRSSYLGSSR
jgi:hypothetical protein